MAKPPETTAPEVFDTVPAYNDKFKSPGEFNTMEKALRGWLESHGLLAIIAAVLGIISLLAMTLVLGGFWLAR